MLWCCSIVFVVLCTPTPGIPHLVHTPWVVSVLHLGMDTLTLYLYLLMYYSYINYSYVLLRAWMLPYTLALLALRQVRHTVATHYLSTVLWSLCNCYYLLNIR